MSVSLAPLRPAHHSAASAARPRRTIAALGAVVVAVLIPPLFGPGVGGAAGTDVGAAEAGLQEARAARAEAELRLADADAEKASLLAEIERLDSGAAQITEDLAAAHRAVREYAVAAYIDGGQSALVGAALDLDENASLAWRAQIVGSQTVESADAVDHFNALKRSNDPDRVAAASRLDDVTSVAEEALSDALQAAAHERDAESTLALAREAEANAAAEAQAQANARAQAEAQAQAATRPAPRAARSSGTASGAGSATTSAVPAAPAPASTGSGSGSPTASESATLAKIRRCESRGNYGIVSASGKYRGAYQFDYRTWGAVGGSGDPAAASPAEQDYRALLLLRQRGTRPWPNCG